MEMIAHWPKRVTEKAFQEKALIRDRLEYDNLPGVPSLKSLKGLLLGKHISSVLVLSYSQGKEVVMCV